jgi:hypothetical protein
MRVNHRKKTGRRPWSIDLPYPLVKKRETYLKNTVLKFNEAVKKIFLKKTTTLY